MHKIKEKHEKRKKKPEGTCPSSPLAWGQGSSPATRPPQSAPPSHSGEEEAPLAAQCRGIPPPLPRSPSRSHPSDQSSLRKFKRKCIYI